ncbi:FUSC family protein [Gammaproteobacteria bacterium]|nr:FUSC family protein [Gammaproteobacteria bacterium]
MFSSVTWERLSHSIKTALACLVGFLITALFSFDIDQWLIITIIVVMCAQLRVGSVIQKSYMRFLGTLSGSIIALITIILFSDNELAYAFAIAGSAMIFSYIATGEKSYAESGTLGAATVVIILIGQDPTLKIALERFMEISLGILIAAVISQFIFPVHARKHLKQLQSETIKKLKEFYLINQGQESGIENYEEYQNLEEVISQLLIMQRKLSVEAARELMGEEFKKIKFQQLLRTEIGIRRSITFMHYINQRLKSKSGWVQDEKSLKSFQNLVVEILDKAAVLIEKKGNASDYDVIRKNLMLLQSCIKDKNHDFPKSYMYTIEMFVDYLGALVNLLNKH